MHPQGQGKCLKSYDAKRDKRIPSASRDRLGNLLALTRFHRRWSMSRHRFLWLACITLLSFPLSLSAQTTTGTVRGYVKDQNGSPVGDAEVQARQTETGVVRSTASRSDGSYILPGLVPGSYELSVRKIGFAPQRRPVVVQIGATHLADFTVQQGAVELRAVTVEAAPAVEMRTSEVATNVTRQQIEQLPTVNRNFLDLAALAPGMTVSEDRVNGTGFRTFSGGGASPNQSNVFVDGSSLKNDLTGGGVAGRTRVAAIRSRATRFRSTASSARTSRPNTRRHPAQLSPRRPARAATPGRAMRSSAIKTRIWSPSTLFRSPNARPILHSKSRISRAT